MPKKPIVPYWDVSKKGVYLRTPVPAKMLDEGGVVYMSNHHAFGNFLNSNRGIDLATKRAAESVRRTIANRIPLGEESGEGHLKHQMSVARTKGFDGRPAYLVYSKETRTADRYRNVQGFGGTLWNAEHNRKKAGKPMWTKQALKELAARGKS